MFFIGFLSFFFLFRLYFVKDALQPFGLFWIVGQDEIPVTQIRMLAEILQQEIKILVKGWLGSGAEANGMHFLEIKLLPEFDG